MEHEENVTHKLNMINEREWNLAASVDDVKQLYNINNGWGYGDSWRAKKKAKHVNDLIRLSRIVLNFSPFSCPTHAASNQ